MDEPLVSSTGRGPAKDDDRRGVLPAPGVAAAPAPRARPPAGGRPRAAGRPQIVVVLDGSTDGSQEAVEAERGRCPCGCTGSRTAAWPRPATSGWRRPGTASCGSSTTTSSPRPGCSSATAEAHDGAARGGGGPVPHPARASGPPACPAMVGRLLRQLRQAGRIDRFDRFTVGQRQRPGDAHPGRRRLRRELRDLRARGLRARRPAAGRRHAAALRRRRGGVAPGHPAAVAAHHPPAGARPQRRPPGRAPPGTTDLLFPPGSRPGPAARLAPAPAPRPASLLAVSRLAARRRRRVDRCTAAWPAGASTWPGPRPTPPGWPPATRAACSWPGCSATRRPRTRTGGAAARGRAGGPRASRRPAPEQRPDHLPVGVLPAGGPAHRARPRCSARRGAGPTRSIGRTRGRRRGGAWRRRRPGPGRSAMWVRTSCSGVRQSWCHTTSSGS